MTDSGPLSRTPYYFLGPRPFQEAECAAYIRREHARGRDLAEILRDSRLVRGTERSVLRAVLRRPDVIKALGEDVVASIRRQEEALGLG